jgi:hypothetical protein
MKRLAEVLTAALTRFAADVSGPLMTARPRELPGMSTCSIGVLGR